MKKTGDTVAIKGKKYTLGERLGGGTEGAVFDIVEDPSFVLKLLNTAKMRDGDKQAVMERLKWLMEKRELKYKLALPKALTDGDLGYIMRKADGYQKLDNYLVYPKDEQGFSQWLQVEYRLKKRLQIIRFMFNALEEIHINGLIFTDLSPNNIMVHSDKNSLVFIDTDNMRRREDPYTGVLGTDGYMAPEIYHVIDSKLAEKLRDRYIKVDPNVISYAGKLSVESDIFSAAIIAFELLTLQHPFVGSKAEKGTAEEETEARQCKTEYILHKNGLNPCSDNPFVELFRRGEVVTDEISQLFCKTFVDGKSQPKLRPSAQEFYLRFDEALDYATKCPDCGVDLLDGCAKCWYCGIPISDHISLRISDFYEKKDVASRIANSNYEFESILIPDGIRLSKVVFSGNEKRYLYLRHFMKASRHNKPLFAITITDELNKKVRIDINSETKDSLTANASLIGRQGSSIPIDRGREFGGDEYDICFEIIDSRVGKIKTMGCFYNGGKRW